jgi:hypothetical protein
LLESLSRITPESGDPHRAAAARPSASEQRLIRPLQDQLPPRPRVVGHQDVRWMALPCCATQPTRAGRIVHRGHAWFSVGQGLLAPSSAAEVPAGWGRRDLEQDGQPSARAEGSWAVQGDRASQLVQSLRPG